MGLPLVSFKVATLSENTLEYSTLETLCDLVGENRRVLNFVSGSPQLSEMLEARGCAVVAVATDVEAPNENQASHQILRLNLDFDSVKDAFPDQRFDVALFDDVVERLHDPWALLKETRTILNPEGSVVLAVRNITHGAIQLSESIGEFDYTTFGLLGGSRLRFFSRSLIEQLFIRAGYYIETIDRTILPLFENSTAVPSVNEADFDALTIERIRGSEDYETLDFIIRARPLDDAAASSQLEREFAAAASRVEQLKEQSAVHDFELRAVAANLGTVTSERDEALTHLAALQLRIEHLETLRSRAVDALHETREELAVLRSSIQAERRERETTARTLSALTARYETLYAEQAAVEAYCRRLSGSLQDARGRTFTAEKALYDYLKPFADDRGLLDDAQARFAQAAAWDTKRELILNQLNSLDEHLQRSDQEVIKLRASPIEKIGRIWTRLLASKYLR